MAMIGLVVLLVNASPDDGAPSADTPLLNQPAPEAVGELDDGTPFDLSRRKGSWVVMNFFQSDCVPCIQEHPELIEFVDQQRSLGGDGAEFYSIVYGDTRDARRASSSKSAAVTGPWSTPMAIRSRRRSASRSFPRRGSSTRRVSCVSV